MIGETDPAAGMNRRIAWRQAPVVLAAALVAVVITGQLITSVDNRAWQWIVGPTLVLLDLTGAAFSWRAARHSPSGPAPWRLIAVGRAASVLAVGCLSAAALGAATAWWWVGMLARLSMFLLLACGVLFSVVKVFAGRSRTALIAETVTILAAAFMLIWYVTLEPVLEQQRPAYAWGAAIGWPLGDALLIAAAAAVVLRGAITRQPSSITLFTAGMALYAAADVTWAATETSRHPASGSPVALTGTVVASLLMSIAPMITVTRAAQPMTRRTGQPPAWVTHLPMAAMLVGCLLMLIVTVIEDQLLPWGGLVCGMIVMTCTAALRQMLSLREIRDQVVSDALTGLANRAGLDEALDRIAKRGEPCALLLLDLDGFKLVNDAYGHAAGDEFLTHVGRQLRAAVRGRNVTARIGGDEFAVLLPGITGIEQAAAVAERILTSTAEHPVHIEDDTVPVRASVGVALAAVGDDGKTLIRHADVAMYHSKRAGTHGHTCYDPSMVDHRAVNAALAEDLEHALARGQLYLLYQPLVDLADGRPIAAEALLRWQHPTRGLVSPVEFIPVAERTGIITSIGLWVLEQAIRQLQAVPRPADGRTPLYISVNVSPRQLREPGIVHDILAVVERCGLDLHRLVLEITESALIEESGGVTALRALREHGIRIAIDDFGTGYSSLQYLTRLPVDILKIDRSFVAELDTSTEGSAVTEAILRLSQVLHLSTVAEGIETEHQAAALRALGCNTGQGYLFARPLAPEAFTNYVTATRPVT